MIVIEEMQDQNQQISQALRDYSSSGEFSLTDLLGRQDWNRPNQSQKFGREDHLVQLEMKGVLPIQIRLRNYPGCGGDPMSIKLLFDKFTTRVKGRNGLQPGSPYLFRRLVCHIPFHGTTSDVFPRFHLQEISRRAVLFMLCYYGGNTL
jgi:hypothetical protein